VFGAAGGVTLPMRSGQEAAPARQPFVLLRESYRAGLGLRYGEREPLPVYRGNSHWIGVSEDA